MTDSKPAIGFIFRITNDMLLNTFKKNENGDTLLPFVVLRRMDCHLADKKEAIRNTYLNFKDKVTPSKLNFVLQKTEKKRDTENNPLNKNINIYSEKEVKQYASDAWIDYDKTRIGYEISFLHYFYK